MTLLRTITLLCFLTTFHSFSQTVEKNVVKIPNIFTPNGDGVNDIFRVDASGFEELTCTIYNRYGETIYRFEGLHGSWDGYTHGGVKVSPGVYYVYVEITIGTETLTDHETLQVQY